LGYYILLRILFMRQLGVSFAVHSRFRENRKHLNSKIKTSFFKCGFFTSFLR